MVNKSRWEELLAEVNGKESPTVAREREIERLEREQQIEQVKEAIKECTEHIIFPGVATQEIHAERQLYPYLSEYSYVNEPADRHAQIRETYGVGIINPRSVRAALSTEPCVPNEIELPRPLDIESFERPARASGFITIGIPGEDI